MALPLSVVGRVLRAPAALSRLELRADEAEAVKWFAAVLMLLDHANTYLFAGAYPVLFVLGRTVFPLFLVSLGAVLAERDDDALRRAVKRTFTWACIAQPVSMLVRSDAPLNVLFVICAGLWVVALIERRSWKLLWAAPVLLVAAGLAEFGPSGLVASVALIWWSRHRSAPAAVGAVFGVALLQLVNVTHAALLAFPAAWAVKRLGLHVPRVRNAFQWVYVLQWPLLLIVGWAL